MLFRRSSSLNHSVNVHTHTHTHTQSIIILDSKSMTTSYSEENSCIVDEDIQTSVLLLQGVVGGENALLAADIQLQEGGSQSLRLQQLLGILSTLEATS